MWVNYVNPIIFAPYLCMLSFNTSVSLWGPVILIDIEIHINYIDNSIVECTCTIIIRWKTCFA